MGVRFNLPLPPARTDTDWIFDFAWEFPGADPAVDWTGDSFTLDAVQRVKSGPAATIQLTSGATSLQLLGPTRVGIRVPKATMATLQAQLGHYEFELRRLGLDGTIEELGSGDIPIIQGVSQLTSGDPLPGGSLGGAEISGFTIITDATGARVTANAAGPIGPRGYPAFAGIIFQIEELSPWPGFQDVALVRGVLPVSVGGCSAYARHPATATTVIPILINDAEQGSITFAPSSNTGEFAWSVSQITDGQRLSLQAPSPPDLTLAGFLFTFAGDQS